MDLDIFGTLQLLSTGVLITVYITNTPAHSFIVIVPWAVLNFVGELDEHITLDFADSNDLYLLPIRIAEFNG